MLLQTVTKVIDYLRAGRPSGKIHRHVDGQIPTLGFYLVTSVSYLKLRNNHRISLNGLAPSVSGEVISRAQLERSAASPGKRSNDAMSTGTKLFVGITVSLGI